MRIAAHDLSFFALITQTLYYRKFVHFPDLSHFFSTNGAIKPISKVNLSVQMPPPVKIGPNKIFLKIFIFIKEVKNIFKIQEN